MLVLQVIPKFMVLVLTQLDYMQESENQEQQLLQHKPKTVLQQSKQVVCLSQLVLLPWLEQLCFQQLEHL
jgi:hypothetical protein